MGSQIVRNTVQMLWCLSLELLDYPLRLHGKSAQKPIRLLMLSRYFRNVFRPFHLNEKTVTLFIHLPSSADTPRPVISKPLPAYDTTKS